MSSYSTEERVLRITEADRRRINDSTASETLLRQFIKADIVICRGWRIKDRFRTEGSVPKGHGDVKIALDRQLPPFPEWAKRRAADEHHDFPLPGPLPSDAPEPHLTGGPRADPKYVSDRLALMQSSPGEMGPGLAPGSMERAFSGRPTGSSPSEVMRQLGVGEGQGQSRRARKRRERREAGR